MVKNRELVTISEFSVLFSQDTGQVQARHSGLLHFHLPPLPLKLQSLHYEAQFIREWVLQLLTYYNSVKNVIP